MPRVSDRGRVAAGISTLALVLTILMIQVITAGSAAAAQLVVVPGAVPGGLPATVTGFGFEDEPVTLCWDRDDDDDYDDDDDDDDDDDEDSDCANLGEVVPVAGTFSVQITIPDADSGQHLISACQSEGCSSAGIEVLSSDTTMPPETTTTTLEPTTSTPTTSGTIQTTTTTPSSSTTTVFGSTTSQPSSSPSTTAGPTQGPTAGPGTTLVDPSPPPIFGPSPPPIFGSPTTSLPGTTETGPLAEDEDQEEDQDQEGLFGRSDADPPVPSLDSVLSGVFTPAPEASSDSELAIGPLDGGTPLPQASIGPDPQAQQSSGNRSPADFAMPDLGMLALWLVVTVGVSAVALTFDAVRQRRNH